MKRTPPPLQLLPAFEAAARLLSFKKAAEEINVTPSAVSQQIKTLESLMDEPLFNRQAGGIVLTQLGLEYYAIAAQLLATYKSSYHRLYSSRERPILRVSTMAQIALDLLIPKIPDFQQRFKHIDLRIETSDELADFEAQWIDAAIRVGEGNWPGLNSYKLCDLTATVMIAPEVLNAKKRKSFADFSDIQLIHSRTHTDDWAYVSESFDIDISSFTHMHFDSYYAAISAAEMGLGLVLGMLPLSQKYLDEGRLVSLNAEHYTMEPACYLCYPPALEGTEKLEMLKVWLKGIF
ncbi:MAG: LysR family transcriptional regulator [Pseudomonadales bacterium]|nr:LysR family transcriptional regulator [Pseudomonadales bacterium]